jgi:hypothetical protein
MDQVARFLQMLHAREEVQETARKILMIYRYKEAAMSKDKSKKSIETDERAPKPWTRHPRQNAAPKTDYARDKAHIS